VKLLDPSILADRQALIIAGTLIGLILLFAVVLII
jgi:hypothetical protein